MTDDVYVLDQKFTTSVARSPRVVEVAEAFGLGLDDQEFVVFDQLKLTVPQGSIVYFTGQSGSGKSIGLRMLAKQMAERGKSVINLDEVKLDHEKTLVDQIGKDTNDALRLLSIAGLNDAYLFIRRPQELSDGQRYRFCLAKAIETGAQVWVADEFLAVLDRTAAKVIAYSLQKTARKVGATVIVATTHTDMVRDLQPSHFIEKRYREKLRVETQSALSAETPTTERVYRELLGVM